ncbi:hypothetical protein PTTG_02608 [Puccinia triticina 1-1 BBBD Race 1]|uniref:Tyrosine specific protein phosphatases domain-containing protein n=2 Tax=Puccinia triticina TaxID=208348 RepID=A0A180GDK7_PUCT1|nr:uncharacterized protein PtA15_1A68 [Puccinia triticina]OAV90528.1 hypothetical protein PTTG_02608 [Puccinia triticina 1-1 BBBD Race 1]WAQ80730.1 hypothetical protein PtA15_1A68 [Puccinia triticina]WAR51622.1 hypothetical protein PtB15_1B58 [Puccinia triticina]
MANIPESLPMRSTTHSTGKNSRPTGSIPPKTQTHHPRTSSSRASISHLASNQLPQSYQPFSSTFSSSAVPDRLHFHNIANGVVKSRQGSVLNRGSLLKTDYFASGRAQSLTHHLQGAPNFRSASYNIFGTAQPTLAGIKTVLAFLKSHPAGRKKSVWFCTREEPVIYMSARPFVLRDSVKPTQCVTSSENADNIEAIELRLKTDIIKESQKYGGLVLVHDETVEGDILPTWITADDVKTTREMWEEVKSEGYHVEYYRIPIANDQAPEDSYLDRYVAILRTIPTSTNLIFNCGMGLVRTTFAMSAAIIMRRRQVIKEGGEDLFGLESAQAPGETHMDNCPSPLPEGGSFGPGFKAIKALTILGEQQHRTRSLLRLMQLLQRSLPTASQHSVMELLTTQPNLLENLRKGISGEFDIVLSLVSILDRGNLEKDLVDMVVDHCDDVVNLRDEILEDRIKFAITATTDQSSATPDETSGNHYLRKALSGLERYFFLIAFAGYCNEPPMSFVDTFSPWLKTRSEILNMILRLRRTSRQYIFAPLHDLTSLSKSHVGTLATTAEMKLNFNDLERAGGEVVGMEWAHHVVDTRRGITLRAGLILKSDQWPTQFHHDDRVIPGALNFRKVPDVALFGLSQPTQEGIERVIEDVRKKHKNAQRLTWINLREEPLIYINGVPYVLRLEAVGLRNLKSYAGISSPRLELLEDRLKSDILAELRAFDGRILLHTETDDGSVIGVWETATESAVKTLRELMDEKSKSLADVCKLDFRRQPITAEKAPDFEDIKDLIGIVSDAEPDAPFIVNCQLGRGRSTLTCVCILLIQQWLAHGGGKFAFAEVNNRKPSRWSYQTINNLIRVMRNGRGIKTAVDAAIEKCSAVYDLIESIEVCRLDAEKCGDDSAAKEKKTKKGLSNLRRYAFLLIFACYLNETKADTWRELQNNKSFEAFWQQHQVFKTLLDELNGAEIQALTPLELGTFASHGGDWTEEEQTVVARRSGIILSAQTILKSDFFVGLQKMTLPMRVEGLPNIRQVPISLKGQQAAGDQSIFGSGMPTVDGLRRGLEKMGAMKRMVYWTSMREEPVLYVQGRPHVLRLFDQPLENVVTTGVAAAAVEGMEDALKNDVLNEIIDRGGRILLHDEVEENGKFIVTAVWEIVDQKQIMTPREVFNLMKDEGFLVDYARLPVTDEQAPIPGVFSRLEQRVTRALKSIPEEELAAHLVFNCQMGRGRTTTGMVAAMLVANSLKMNKTTRLERTGSISSLASADLSTPAPGSPHSPTLSIGGDTWDVPQVNPYLEGEYKIILSLISVLPYGRLAKKLTDRAIDAMDSVQNLRKAVYDFKLRAEAAEPGSEKQRKILTAATNYLYRYGSLIAFSNWLLERQLASSPAEDTSTTPTKSNAKSTYPQSADDGMKTFPEWLNDHREVLHILQKRSLE